MRPGGTAAFPLICPAARPSIEDPRWSDCGPAPARRLLELGGLLPTTFHRIPHAMKKPFYLAALALALASPFAWCAAQDWEADVRRFDTAYWDAYNKCDITGLAAMNSADLEFYHDQGGPMLGQQQFASAMQNNICGNPAVRVRRAALADTVRVYPMRANRPDAGQLLRVAMTRAGRRDCRSMPEPALTRCLVPRRRLAPRFRPGNCARGSAAQTAGSIRPPGAKHRSWPACATRGPGRCLSYWRQGPLPRAGSSRGSPESKIR
jgi:hypothetical protein